MVAAMQKANSTDPKKYLPELAKIQYDGVTGRISFDKHGDVKDGTLTLYTFKNGAKTQMMVTK
jgi:branched-chain amino acid transport system substrate-binding protein